MSDLQLPNPPDSWNKIHGKASSNFIQFCKLHPLDGNMKMGKISWYGGKFIGRHTASGELYTGNDLTAASPLDKNGDPIYALGTHLLITNGDRQVTVIVNDTGSFAKYGRLLDLSPAAFRQLADLKTGVIDATIQEV